MKALRDLFFAFRDTSLPWILNQEQFFFHQIQHLMQNQVSFLIFWSWIIKKKKIFEAPTDAFLSNRKIPTFLRQISFMNCTLWAVCGFVLMKGTFTHDNRQTLITHLTRISPPKSLQPPGNAPSHNPLKAPVTIPHPGTKIFALCPLQTANFCV